MDVLFVSLLQVEIHKYASSQAMEIPRRDECSSNHNVYSFRHSCQHHFLITPLLTTVRTMNLLQNSIMKTEMNSSVSFALVRRI